MKTRKPRSIIEQCASSKKAVAYAKRHALPVPANAKSFKSVEPDVPMTVRKGYNPKPFYKMTDAELCAFASRQALEASDTIQMTQEEMQQYAVAIFGAIKYFNKRDKRHADYMLYLEECRLREEARQREEKP